VRRAKSSGWRVPSDVKSEVFDGDAVVVDLRTGYYFSLNRTATLVWLGLKEGRDLQETVGRIVEEFAVDRLTAERDCQTLIEELASRGLLEPVP
jgi:hypothetical protein